MSVFLRRVSEQKSVFFCFSRFIINKISFNFQQLPQNIFLLSNLQYTVGYAFDFYCALCASKYFLFSSSIKPRRLQNFSLKFSFIIILRFKISFHFFRLIFLKNLSPNIFSLQKSQQRFIAEFAGNCRDHAKFFITRAPTLKLNNICCLCSP